jgi:hypothetical protein
MVNMKGGGGGGLSADQSAGKTLSTICNVYVMANRKGVRGVEWTNQRVRHCLQYVYMMVNMKGVRGRADQSAGKTWSTIWNVYVTANMKGVRG